MNMKINTLTQDDFSLLMLISTRAVHLAVVPQEVVMDIYNDMATCHKSIPLQLNELLKAPVIDFKHEVLGISGNFDPFTGKFTRGFYPRYAILDKKPANTKPDEPIPNKIESKTKNDLNKIEKRLDEVELALKTLSKTTSTKEENKFRWAEGLLRQLPTTHQGRNSWLLNYGTGPDVEKLRDQHPTYRKDERKGT